MFYIFHGDDTYTNQQTLAALQSKADDPDMLALNTTRLEGKNLTLGQLRQVCDVAPFLASRRLVIVTDALADAPKAWLAELKAYLPGLPATTALVFVESQTLPDRHPILVLARADDGKGYEKLSERPKGAAVERWVRQRVTQLGGVIEPRAAALLAANVGNDLRLLDLEVEKLALYCGAEPIRPHHVEQLSPYLAEASIFEFVDALGLRNARKAAQLLQHKLLEGADPFYLFSMVVRQFRLLIQVKEVAEAGLSAAQIAQHVKIHNFVADKLSQQARLFSLEQLEQVYRHLLDIDVGVKTGQQEMVTALALLVGGLTAA